MKRYTINPLFKDYPFELKNLTQEEIMGYFIPVPEPLKEIEELSEYWIHNADLMNDEPMEVLAKKFNEMARAVNTLIKKG